MLAIEPAPLLAKPCYDTDWELCAEQEEAVREAELQARRRSLREQCETGSADACVRVAIMQTDGSGGTVDSDGAEYSLWRACELDAMACRPIAEALALGDYVEKDTALARAILLFGEHSAPSSASKLLSRNEILDLTELLKSNPHAKGYADRVELRTYLRECANTSGADACANAAVMYDRGVGTHEDELSAYVFFRTACDLDRSLCIDIANAYEEGELVRRDRGRAHGFRKRALRRGEAGGCRYGDSERCVTYANAYLRGDRLEHDEQYAAVLFGEACEAGNSRGCTGLAGLRWSGRGIDEDRWRAVELYRIACDGDSGAACWKLGRLYLRGEQVEQDSDHAERLFERGCTLGDQASCDYLNSRP